MDIKVLIIEDEPIARQNLKGMLNSLFPEISVVGETGSVKDSVDFLKQHTGDNPLAPDLIFMDVELSDGNSFDIFKQVNVTSHVIMTTAYSEYAIKAFEAEALDYLLKPLDPESVKRAVGRAKERISVGEPARVITPRERFLIRLNDQIVPVEVRDIAYFYSEAKNSYLITFSGKSFVLDDSLDALESHIDPNLFFRISRSCIINEQAIESMAKLIGGRFRIVPKKGIEISTDLTVSRARSDAFIAWMER